MAIERSEVADIHTLENVLLMRDGALQGIRQTDDTFSTVITQHTFTMHPSRSLEAQGIVGLVGAQVQ